MIVDATHPKILLWGLGYARGGPLLASSQFTLYIQYCIQSSMLFEFVKVSCSTSRRFLDSKVCYLCLALGIKFPSFFGGFRMRGCVTPCDGLLTPAQSQLCECTAGTIDAFDLRAARVQ